MSAEVPPSAGSTPTVERRTQPHLRRRGWLVRRMLVASDVVGLSLACAVALSVPLAGSDQRVSSYEVALFVAAIPVWLVLATLHGLYDRDGERTDYSTVDDVVGVLFLVTLGSWLVFAVSSATGVATPKLRELVAFWGLSLILVPTGRALARSWCRRRPEFIQNTLILGAGHVGQSIGSKFLQHPEYGVNLVGFFDDSPKPRRPELERLTLLGPPPSLRDVVTFFDVERIVVAYSNASDAQVMASLRDLNNLDIQVDVVPRLYELLGPQVTLHSVEALQLLGLPPVRITRSARWIKRTIDVVGALVALILTAPLFVYIAWKVWRESGRPIFYRQTRLGANMREFTALKFRTMRVGTFDNEHREYIRRTMEHGSAAGATGIFKLERADAVTGVGAWLRKTSLDELPQFINILRGEMSLVGPRPCIPYETAYFRPHHFERFLVPQGLTGLWQVVARGRSSFAEALEMDVAYVRGRSLSLDLRLLFRTPVQLLRRGGTT